MSHMDRETGIRIHREMSCDEIFVASSRELERDRNELAFLVLAKAEAFAARDCECNWHSENMSPRD